MRADFVYLVQTDTTVGFLSKSAERLARLKGRPSQKPFLKAISRLSALGEIGRVPRKFRREIRRSRGSSYILPNGQSFRLVRGDHRDFVKKFKWCYSTSANRHGEPYDEKYAKEACDVVVESKDGFHAAEPSRIWRVARRKRVKVR